MGIFFGLGIFEILTLLVVVAMIAGIGVVVGFVLGRRDRR